MKKILLLCVLALVITSALFSGCTSSPKAPEPVPSPASTPAPTSESKPEESTPESKLDETTPIKGKIILATTTSTEDSGLLDYILPEFTRETGWEVDTVSVGTGAAIKMGRDGEADVLLVHSRADEDKFVEDGCAENRYDVMYNDYVIVGPSGGTVSYNDNVSETFKTISADNLKFVSRGDDSGTHKKELSIWKVIGIEPESNTEYTSAGQGMGATLGMAKEIGAYTLSDRATWLTYAGKDGLEIVCEKSKELLNPYGVIPVSASVSDKINTEGGHAFANWITGESAQKLIASFGVEKFGQPLFTPDAK